MPHQHDHDHSHDPDQHPGHDHSHAPLSFSEKLVKLLDHWVQHNDHHADDYRKWAQQARDNDQESVATLLDAAAAMTDTISEQFREARGNVR